jgi:hypothetical protein
VSSFRAWLKLNYAYVLVTLGILYVSLYVYDSSDSDWSATASVAQALVAMVLVWITAATIARADSQLRKSQDQIDISIKQIEISNQQTQLLREQVNIANTQLGKGTEPNILGLLEILESPHEQNPGGLSLVITNLSAFPIYINRVTVRDTNYGMVMHLDYPKRTLHPADSSQVIILNKERMETLDHDMKNLIARAGIPSLGFDLIHHKLSNGERLFPFSLLEIEIYYPPMSHQPFLHKYRFQLFGVPGTLSYTGSPWDVELTPTGISKRVGDGSWVPTWTWTLDGQRRPDNGQ